MTRAPRNRLNSRLGALRRLAEPDPVLVSVDRNGEPTRVGERQVMAVRESWLVEDRWWTAQPIRRHYWEIVDSKGAVKTVFREPGGRWLKHR